MGPPPGSGPPANGQVAAPSPPSRRGVVLGALLALALGGVAWTLWSFRRPLPSPSEIEPNDRPEGATRVVAGRVVTGDLGRGAPTDPPDRDFYRIDIPRGPRQQMRIEVITTAEPDLVVEVADEKGIRLTSANNAGPSGAEAIPNLSVSGGQTRFVVVTEPDDSRPPADPASRSYRLRIGLRTLGPNDETEPNDDPGRATRLRLASPMLAFSSSASDVDCFTVPGPGGGSLEGEVAGLEGVDLMVEVHEADGSGEPDVVDQGGIAAAERFGAAWPKGGAPSFCVRRKPHAGAAPAPTGDDPASFASPYFLVVRRTP